MTPRRTRGSISLLDCLLQNDCNEHAAPRIVTPLYYSCGDNGGDPFAQSPQSQYVTPLLASGRSPSLATPSPSSTCLQYTQQTRLCRLFSRMEIKLQKYNHPLANFLDSRGKNRPVQKGWFRLAVFGKAGGQLKKPRKTVHRVAQYDVALSHLSPNRGPKWNTLHRHGVYIKRYPTEAGYIAELPHHYYIDRA
jgi:hypothetical protein